MSNHLAIAATTYVLQRHIQRVLGFDVAGATTTTVRPDGDDGQLASPGVNLYLYQAIPNSALANYDLPTRDSRGGGTRKPTVAYDLMYLMTFHGSEASLEPQRVMGSVLRHLHSQPLLATSTIRTILQNAIAADPNFFLRKSDLANQFDSLKITPVKLSLEDLSKIWSVFFQTNYILSAAISVTAVWLEANEPAREAFPVVHPQIFVPPFADIQVDDVNPSSIVFAPGATVSVLGRGLIGAGREIRIGATAGVLQPGATATTAELALPASTKAGVTSVSVLDFNPLGAGHSGFQSNSVPLLVRPTVDTITFVPDASARKDHSIQVTSSPQVGLDQNATLMLNRVSAGDPTGYALPLRTRGAIADPLQFDARGLAAGTYIYRLRVDGADSALTRDMANPDPLQQPFNGPTLVIP